MKIPITKPYFDETERQSILEPLASGWLVQGPKVKEFEEAVRKYTGVRYARATTSCTTALHLALLASGIGPGDEVVLPSFTFIASANAVEYVGARPIFVDIDLDTFNIDSSKIPCVITNRTKAIMPVHLFGLSADMRPIMEIAEANRLRVIEDAACAVGSFYQGKHAGAIGDAGCLSFHPRKSVTTGEGGMVLTNNPEIAHRVEIQRDHGAEVSDLARHQAMNQLLPEYNTLGYNYRMTDLQGSLGVAQMQKLPYILERKRELATRYTEAFSQLKWLRPPIVPDEYVHGYQSYVCLFAPEQLDGITPTRLEKLVGIRKELMQRLDQAGIATRQGTHAVHAIGYYREKYGLNVWDFTNSWLAENLSIAFPLYPQMTPQEQAYVLESVKRSCALD